MEHKRGLEMSFTWLFALIVGAFILFLAIYFVTKFIHQEETEIDAKTSKEIGILLNPLETGFESSKVTSLEMPVESRIYNKCNSFGTFGRQLIQVSQKNFNKWTETNIDVGFANKYIFSEIPIEGKKFYVFSKPFEFPFKVSDLIYMTSSEKNYCFDGAPDEIKDELESLGQENIFTENCPDESIEVCFSGSCDIEVNYDEKIVEKNRKTLNFYGDALMYAAIFADEDVYECQLKRLMQRTEQLALLYNDKAGLVARTGCNSNLNLIELSNSARGFDDSHYLISMSYTADEIKEQNEMASCRLW